VTGRRRTSRPEDRAIRRAGAFVFLLASPLFLEGAVGLSERIECAACRAAAALIRAEGGRVSVRWERTRWVSSCSVRSEGRETRQGDAEPHETERIGAGGEALSRGF
jgi:hypothetical protein